MSTDSKITISNWLNEYGDELYSWAFHKTSNKEIAEDLVQDTFLSAFTNFDKFQEINKTKPEDERLKVAISFSVDTSNGNNQLETNSNLHRAIKEYNKILSSNRFLYYLFKIFKKK